MKQSERPAATGQRAEHGLAVPNPMGAYVLHEGIWRIRISED